MTPQAVPEDCDRLGIGYAYCTEFLGDFQGSACRPVFVEDGLYSVKEGNFERPTGCPKDYFSTAFTSADSGASTSLG